MKCFNCGAEIKMEYKICPYCSSAIQIVPDYSVYDEDDINIIVESAKDLATETRKTILTKEEKEARAKAKQQALEEAKKKKMQITIAIVCICCALVVAIGVIAKLVINRNNSKSFEYQMKQADSAMFKGEIDDAEKYYLKALELEPKNIDVRLELADVYIKKHDTEKAIKLLKEVIKVDDLNYDAYKMLFDVYTEAGDTDAILALKSGITDNKILSIFTDYNVDAPMLSVPGDTYEEDIKLSISAKKGVEIYYTLDGSDPKKNGIKYDGSFEITGAGLHTVKAVTKNKLGVFSEVISETYMIEYAAPEDPVVTPNGGTFNTKTYAYISVPSGCSAYYTWDRTEPTEASTKYVSPILIPEGKNMLSVIIIDDETDLMSGIYRGMFEYTEVIEE